MPVKIQNGYHAAFSQHSANTAAGSQINQDKEKTLTLVLICACTQTLESSARPPAKCHRGRAPKPVSEMNGNPCLLQPQSHTDLRKAGSIWQRSLLHTRWKVRSFGCLASLPLNYPNVAPRSWRMACQACSPARATKSLSGGYGRADSGPLRLPIHSSSWDCRN